MLVKSHIFGPSVPLHCGSKKSIWSSRSHYLLILGSTVCDLCVTGTRRSPKRVRGHGIHVVHVSKFDDDDIDPFPDRYETRLAGTSLNSILLMHPGR
jgi:hypothetical protein